MTDVCHRTPNYKQWNAVPQGPRRCGVMVKPIGPACNLDCDYCYYLSKEELLGLHGHQQIADDTLEKFIVHQIAGWGECPRNRFVKTPDGEPGLNYLCPGLKRFFAHADTRLIVLAAQSRGH